VKRDEKLKLLGDSVWTLIELCPQSQSTAIGMFGKDLAAATRLIWDPKHD